MRIQSVVSYLGAWKKLQNNFPHLLIELEKAFAAAQVPQPKPGSVYHRLKAILGPTEAMLINSGWQPEFRIQHGRWTVEGDFIKGKVVLELINGNVAHALTYLFARMPLLGRTEPDLIPIIAFPTKEIARLLPVGHAAFEYLAALVTDVHPFPSRYPFLLIGYGSGVGSMDVKEMTSELDIYLTELHGMTLAEMSFEREHPSYDFKVELPDDTKKVAKEICAMANHLGGGSLLIGISDDGETIGVNQDDLDKIQLKISSIASDRCSPVPSLKFRSFSIDSESNRRILVVRVSEGVDKPCMTDERVFVRFGTSARPAKPEEIRRLVVG